MAVKIISFLLFFILLSSFVVAQPGWASQLDESFNEFIIVEKIKPKFHKLNTDYNIHIQLYNSENGILINGSDATCNYNLFSSSNQWNYIVENGTFYDQGLWLNASIDSSLLTNMGEYTILVWCECLSCGDSVGGFTKHSFYISPHGDAPIYFNQVLYTILFMIAIIFIMTVLMFMFKQYLIGTLLLPINSGLLATLFFIFYWNFISFNNLFFTLYIIFTVISVALLLFAVYEIIYQLLTMLNKRRRSTFGDNL